MKLSHPENIDFNGIRNIIFDWGGVITNINYQKTIVAFEKLGISNFHEFFAQLHQNDLFKKYEVGSISSDDMRTELRKASFMEITDDQIDEAWCAMLLDTPERNIAILNELAKNFRIFLLSNTNEIHAAYYNAHLFNSLNVDFPSIFEKVYYSHIVGMRKPNKDIFEFVLNDSNLIPRETLFIDDTEINTDTAASLGIIALFLQSACSLENIYLQWCRQNK